jgi:subtilisin family serine protease
MSQGPYRHLEYLPEPEDPRMLTAIDPDAPGYPPEAYGASVEQAEAWRHATNENYRRKQPRPWGITAALCVIAALLLAYPQISSYFVGALTPNSDWAYEDTNIYALQDDLGLTGNGILVCIVDTGIEMTHPDISDVNLVRYRDFVEGDDQTIQDRGTNRHGTMMAGILVADGTYRGAAPNVGLVIAAALNSDGSTQSESAVADAIEWCWDDMEVDIISLSLGGDPDPENPLGSMTADAVVDALDHGVFVVAAAGNSGGAGTDVTDVSVPANVDGVIAVGAVDRAGALWERTATGSVTEGADGDVRSEPNQKPEVSAPGVGIISTSDPSLAIPYSASTGTSDATVFVTGALALILERHGEAIPAGNSSRDRITLVKQALADSCQPNPLQGEGHHPRWGYGTLDALAWERAVADLIALSSDTLR